MTVVGGRFRAFAGALAALRAVRGSLAVSPGDVAVRPLGSTRYEVPASDFLLAGRFEAPDVDKVVGIIRAHGGRIVERRNELPRALIRRSPLGT